MHTHGGGGRLRQFLSTKHDIETIAIISIISPTPNPTESPTSNRLESGREAAHGNWDQHYLVNNDITTSPVLPVTEELGPKRGTLGGRSTA